MTILANLQNLNLSFGDKIIFDNTQFQIKEFEKIGLIGLNGKGKSTLLKVIDESVKPDSSTPPFIYDKSKELSILYIPQELSTQEKFLDTAHYYLNFYPELANLHQKLQETEEKLATSVNDQLLNLQSELYNKIEFINGWEIEKSYKNYLKKFLVDETKTISSLSGGQKRKVALSIGLSSKHKLVLWDEPTNHLDIETIEQFEDELKTKNNSFIMISHDRYILSGLCNKIVHLEYGKIQKFNGNYLDYISAQEELEQERQEKLTKLKNSHRRELAWMRQGIKARGTRSKKRVEGFHSIEKDIQKLKDLKKKNLDFALSHTGRKTKELITISDLNFAYDQTPILKDINLKIYKEDRIALIGKNGAGKSTFLNIIMDKLSLQEGNIKKVPELTINYFSQNRVALDLNKTPFELIGDGQDIIHLPNGTTMHINGYLEQFLFSSSEIRRPIQTLSGGEKNRLQLALFMKKAADIWIFDEPTNDLDIETIETLERTLINYKQAVIIVSHDRAFLDRVTTKSWILQKQTIEEYTGNYSDNADLLIEIPKTVEKKKEVTPTAPVQTPKIKLSNKEKMRAKVIDQEVEEAELNLEQLSEQLAGFDFNSMTAETTENYKKLEKEVQIAEQKLESLYEEWENLNRSNE